MTFQFGHFVDEKRNKRRKKTFFLTAKVLRLSYDRSSRVGALFAKT
jgi:hypothetical protein